MSQHSLHTKKKSFSSFDCGRVEYFIFAVIPIVIRWCTNFQPNVMSIPRGFTRLLVVLLLGRILWRKFRGKNTRQKEEADEEKRKMPCTYCSLGYFHEMFPYVYTLHTHTEVIQMKIILNLMANIENSSPPPLSSPAEKIAICVVYESLTYIYQPYIYHVHLLCGVYFHC